MMLSPTLSAVDDTADGPALAGLVLHPALRRVQVQRAVLDVLVDLLRRLQESVLDILSSLGATRRQMGLETHQRQFTGGTWPRQT